MIEKFFIFCLSFLLLYEIGILAQDNRCLLLTENTICGPKFRNAPVLENLFPDVLSFTNYLNSTFNETSLIVSTISSGSNCSLSFADTMPFRYHLTFWCSKIVTDSINLGCKPESPYDGTIICSKTCLLAATTLQNALSKPGVCASASRPTLITDPFQQFCKRTGSTNCLEAVPADENFCGFRSLELAQAMCPTINDECCKTLTAPKLNSSSTVTPTPIATSSAPKSVTSIPKSSIPSPMAFGIAAGTCLILLAILFLVTLCIRRSKTKNDVDVEDESTKDMDSISVQKKMSLSSLSSTSSFGSFASRPLNPESVYGLYTGTRSNLDLYVANPQ